MRPTPKEIAESQDQDLIEKWIDEATPEELREFLQQDISHEMKTQAASVMATMVFKRAMESQNVAWWIFRAALVIVLLVIVGIILHWLHKH